MVCDYECPFHGCPQGHLSIIFGEKTSSFRCVKCKSQGSIFLLLSKVKKLDFIVGRTYDREKKLEKKLNVEKIGTDYSNYKLPPFPKPLGFKRVFEDKYLEERGFTKEQFDLFQIGKSKLDINLKNDYSIILVEEDKETIGWIARSVKSKKEINEINLLRKKQGNKVKYLRWRNSTSEFEKALLGIDELSEETKTVILVEGPTSKFSVDRKLNLYSQKDLKCLCTFGKKISGYQIKKLYDKGIENIILLYDPDAVQESKQYSLELDNYFNTLVGFIPFYDKDPDDLNVDQLYDVLENLERPLDFYKNKIAKKELL